MRGDRSEGALVNIISLCVDKAKFGPRKRRTALLYPGTNSSYFFPTRKDELDSAVVEFLSPFGISQ